MAKFKNEKGLTLIELLITIAVLAVVSAIALPVINNVVSSSNSNASVQTQNDVNDFITKYNAAGEVLLSTDGRTLQGYVDTDGDNTIDSNELVDTLAIDAKFSFSAAGTSDNVGGSFASKGISGATVGLASAGTTTPPTTGFTTTLTAAQWVEGGGGDFGGTGSCNWASGTDLKFYCGLSTNAQTALATLGAGQSVEISYYDGTSVVVLGTYTVSSVTLTGTPMITFNEPVSIPGDFRQIRF